MNVELTGATEQIEEVRMCDAEVACSPSDDGGPPTTTASSSVEPTKYAARKAGTVWMFSVLTRNPESVTLTAYRADGSEAAEMTTELAWRQVGGTAKCGGPLEAGPIQLAIS